MNLLSKLRGRLPLDLFPLHETDVEEAYNMWSLSYDAQPDNLMLALDDEVFSELISDVDFKDGVIADIGCGTGRQWEKIYAKKPSRVVGYDVSEGMLKVLKKKFPHAETYQLKTTQLKELENSSCDFIVSILAIAHISNIDVAFAEWNRVLKKDGQIIITDYHPDTLSKGGNRTFEHEGKLIAVKNYIHPIAKIREVAAIVGFKFDRFIERNIDETVKHYYEKKKAIHVYERFRGTPIIYGAHLTRENAVK